MESLILLLSHDVMWVEPFVGRHLGPVEAVDNRAELLLGTLQADLAHGQRPANASVVCGCHTDTVHNRLLEIEQALGCTVEERSLELALALRLRPLLYGSISRPADMADRLVQVDGPHAMGAQVRGCDSETT